MSPRADLYSKKMGELLLKGWRMLEEECPLTHDLTECAKLLSRAAAPPPHGLVETMAQCADALAATERAKALFRTGPH
ncbi:hypothetical protein EMIHUDRAFT_241314 [Emiliania huxleyi CCMP1516]|uniref:HEPN domain-containing protein n=2 Tax=Emiliania huxleyi TaxID=2903 RepID=A0A0D3JCV9_EMIH1|nr:hypothetical protein EMIHUDRAFT_241314 [Emiliania huxleyi CCMP1516]EOD21344.1 hypothetical protein EMIHUDRAFT_241314 [Emiliania huxleyi CCMP1516]|eukprot:XP_005773773.1 hypothetical protein EMIHUDRAFT_241314 [Emiliania huxleyi CCMP1516]